MRENGQVTPEPAREPVTHGGPAYLRPPNLALVFAGGTAGVLAREALVIVLPDIEGLPIAVLVANVAGALLLGVLLTALAAGEETSARRTLRLLFGTGLLGGFTTYSALAQAVALLTIDGSAGLAIAYGLGTVVLGGLATWLGIALGAVLGRRVSSRDPATGCGAGEGDRDA